MSRAARAVAPLLSRVLAGILLVAWAASPAHGQEIIEYYGTDALGSIRVVFDAAGTVVARTDYLPFGETFEASGNGPAEGFTGQGRDGEAGLDYFHARMYQPRTGRFNAVDPVYAGLFDPQQWNRYAYARNNPLRFVDPLGLELQCAKTEYWENVDVAYGPDGGKRDSVPVLRYQIVCVDYGETTFPPPFSPPTGPGDWSGPGGGGGGHPPRPHDEDGDDEGTPEAPGDDGCKAEGVKRLLTPDYVAAQVSAGIGWGGATLVYAVDRFGGTYFGVGPNVGKAATLASGSLNIGKIDVARGWKGPLAPTQSKKFLTGWGVNAGGGHIGGGALQYSPGTGQWGLEAGVYTTQAGISGVYNWEVKAGRCR